MVVGLMVVLPIVSVGLEFAVSGGDADLVAAIGKWFLFWGVGVRLFVAGLSQVGRPGFTATNILGTDPPAQTLQIVQELGFANLGMGALGLIAPWMAGWVVPGAIPAVVFLGAAGLRHVVKTNKNSKEVFATVTDLFVAGVLLVFVVVSVA